MPRRASWLRPSSCARAALTGICMCAGILAADVDGMRAHSTLDIDAAVCSGSSPERLAQPFTAYFADDVAEHCQVRFFV